MKRAAVLLVALAGCGGSAARPAAEKTLTAGHPDREGLITELIFGSAGGPDVVAMPLSDLEDGMAELDLVLRR